MSTRLFSLVLMTLMVTGCNNNKCPVISLPYSDMQEGDLAFRCGYGFFSRAVTAVEQERSYSHVGILIKDSVKWMVAHAVPGEIEFQGDFPRVKIEPIEDYYTPSRANKGCLVHTGVIDNGIICSVHSLALRYVRDSVRFDEKYNLNDSTRVYCTEFVWRLYRKYEIDLTEGRRLFIKAFNIHNECILPEHLLAYRFNRIYYIF